MLSYQDHLISKNRALRNMSFFFFLYKIQYSPFCFAEILFCTCYPYFTVRVCVQRGAFLDLHADFRRQPMLCWQDLQNITSHRSYSENRLALYFGCSHYLGVFLKSHRGGPTHLLPPRNIIRRQKKFLFPPKTWLKWKNSQLSPTHLKAPFARTYLKQKCGISWNPANKGLTVVYLTYPHLTNTPLYICIIT